MNSEKGYSGGCLCGAITYEIDRTHLNAIHCYCGMCRKAHGTAFSTHAIARPDQVAWKPGEEALVTFESSPGAYRKFCPHCGTHLAVHGQSGDGTVAIPAGTLDGNPELTIVGHMYTDALVDWFTIEDTLPQYAQWPPGYGRS